MRNNSFYAGILFELEKRAESTQVTAAGPAKPQPAPMAAPKATPAAVATPNIQPQAQAPHPATTPQPTPQPAPQPFLPAKPNMQSWWANAFTSNDSINKSMDQQFQHVDPNHPPEISETQRGVLARNPVARQHFNQHISQLGTNRIQNASIFDAGKLAPQDGVQKQIYDYGMSTPDVRNQWSKAIEDKTYGFGTINQNNEIGMNEHPKFQWQNFLKDHWGKLLMALLGAGLLGGGLGAQR
jgi:hypothetical protein